MKNYNYELSMLRSAAIETITAYVVANGAQTIKNYSPGRQYIKLAVIPFNTLDTDAVLIRGATAPQKIALSVKFVLTVDGHAATEEGADLLCAIASVLAKPVTIPEPIKVPKIRLPYKDE